MHGGRVVTGLGTELRRTTAARDERDAAVAHDEEYDTSVLDMQERLWLDGFDASCSALTPYDRFCALREARGDDADLRAVTREAMYDRRRTAATAAYTRARDWLRDHPGTLIALEHDRSRIVATQSLAVLDRWHDADPEAVPIVCLGSQWGAYYSLPEESAPMDWAGRPALCDDLLLIGPMSDSPLRGRDWAAWANELKWATGSAELDRELQFSLARAALYASAAGELSAEEEERQAGLVEERERLVEERLRQLEINAEATRRFAATLSPSIGRVLDWDELEKQASRPALVAGLLPSVGTSLLVAKRNLGKSAMAIALAGSVAAGKSFVDRPVEPGRVVYVASEGEAGLPARMRAWASAQGVDATDLRERIRIFGAGVNLSNDASIRELRKAIADFDPTLLIIDTWTGCAGLANEVDQSEQARALHEAKSLLPSGHTIILHHPNSESEDSTAPKSRGGSALPSGVDSVLTLWADRSHSDPGRPGTTFLALSTEDEHAGKQKDFARETIRGLFLEEANGSVYLSVADRVLSSHEQWVLRNVPFGQPITLDELVASSGAGRTTIQRHLDHAPAYVRRLDQKRGSAVQWERFA